MFSTFVDYGNCFDSSLEHAVPSSYYHPEPLPINCILIAKAAIRDNSYF
jgi:hypothetical protein